MTYSYRVSTQHRYAYNGEFIVPCVIEAHAPLEAAEKRFAKQCQESRESTTALLVTDGNGSWVYPVVSSVGPDALLV